MFSCGGVSDAVSKSREYVFIMGPWSGAEFPHRKSPVANPMSKPKIIRRIHVI